MPNSNHTSNQAVRWRRYAARGIVSIWAVCWMFIALTSAAGEGANLTGVIIAISYCLFFLGSAAIAWLWDSIGGVLLMAEGSFVAIVYPVWMSGRISLKFIIFFELTMAVPALVAGVLLLTCWRISRELKKAQDSG